MQRLAKQQPRDLAEERPFVPWGVFLKKAAAGSATAYQEQTKRSAEAHLFCRSALFVGAWLLTELDEELAGETRFIGSKVIPTARSMCGRKDVWFGEGWMCRWVRKGNPRAVLDD